MTVRQIAAAVTMTMVALLVPTAAVGHSPAAQETQAAQADDASASIAGRVVVPDGVDATKMAIRPHRWLDRLPGWVTHPYVRLAEDGSFSLVDLPSGEYRFDFVPMRPELSWGEVHLAATAPETTVTVGIGESLTGLEFVAPLGASVSGHVRVPDGGPWPWTRGPTGSRSATPESGCSRSSGARASRPGGPT